MNWYRYMFFPGICFFMLAAASCRGIGAENIETDLTELAVKATATPVTTMVLNAKEMEVVIRSEGKIMAAHDQLITSETGGLLLRCRVQTGMHVTKGAAMVQLDTLLPRNKLQRLALTRFNAEKEYESQLIGYETLLKGMSHEEAEAVKQKLKISTGLAMAEQDLTESRHELLQSTIRAPFTGIVADMQVQQGDLIKPWQGLFRIYDPGNLQLEIRLLESDIALIRKGLVADVFPLSATTGKYQATINTVNPYVDRDGMVKVSLEMKTTKFPAGKESPALFPGMSCTAVIKIPMYVTLVIPARAIVMRNGKPVVFTVEDNKAKWNDVITGRENGDEVEIKSGLKKGQKVIVSNNLQLSHDAPVKESPEPGNTD